MKRSPKDVVASVRGRLSKISSETGEEFQRLLERYALERFLYRLSVSEHREAFILKGAMLLTAWPEMTARATRDLDFLGRGDDSPESVARHLGEVCDAPVPPDGLMFLTDSLSAAHIRAGARYGGVRVRMIAMLDGARIPVRVDVGFGDVVTPDSEEIDFPTILDSPSPRLRAYPVVSVIAEKLEAVVRFGAANSRLKDFCDLWMLARSFEIDATQLVNAVSATFSRRRTEIEAGLPDGLSPTFFERGDQTGEWRAFLRRSGIGDVPEDFTHVGDELRAFLMPILHAVSEGSTLEWSWRDGAWR